VEHRIEVGVFVDVSCPSTSYCS